MPSGKGHSYGRYCYMDEHRVRSNYGIQWFRQRSALHRLGTKRQSIEGLNDSLLNLIVQSKIVTRMIRLSQTAVLAVLSDTRGHGPCVDPASRTKGVSCHIHAAVPFSPSPRASVFSVPRGGECVWAQVMRAQVSKACANIERVVW